ncbi:uncharacterized protein LOC144105318 [Amblyomma americanum]
MEAARSSSGSSTVAAPAPSKAAKRTFLGRARRLGSRSLEAALQVRNALSLRDAATTPMDIEQAPEPVFEGGSRWNRWERRLTGGTCLAATVVIFTVLVVTLLLTSGSHRTKHGAPRRAQEIDATSSTKHTPWPWIGITNALQGAGMDRPMKGMESSISGRPPS